MEISCSFCNKLLWDGELLSSGAKFKKIQAEVMGMCEKHPGLSIKFDMTSDDVLEYELLTEVMGS